MISSRDLKRLAGTLLIVIGIVLCCGLTTYQYLHCAEMYHLEAYKTQMYDSVLDYFLEVSMGAIIISVLCGGVLVTSGILLRKKQMTSPWSA